MPTLHDLAREAAQAFETATREDGQRYVRRKDDSPEWVAELVRDAAHDRGAWCLDDYRYQYAWDACEYLADPDNDPDGYVPEPDVKRIDLCAWLASDSRRAEMVDKVCRGDNWHPGPSIIECIWLGQYQERWEVYAAVRAWLERRAAEMDDATDDNA